MNVRLPYSIIKILLLLLLVIVVAGIFFRSPGEFWTPSLGTHEVSSPDDLPLCITATPDLDEATRTILNSDIEATPACQLQVTIHKVSTPPIGRSMSVTDVLQMTQEAVSSKSATPTPNLSIP